MYRFDPEPQCGEIWQYNDGTVVLLLKHEETTTGRNGYHRFKVAYLTNGVLGNVYMKNIFHHDWTRLA